MATAKDTEILNKAYPKLFEPLPAKLSGGETNDEGNSEKFVELLKKHVPKSDQDEIPSVLQRNVPLGKQSNKKIKGSAPGKKKNAYLTSQEKRDLGLAKLDKNSLKFKTFKKLHWMWLDYMREIIDFGQISEKNNVENKNNGRIPAILDENLQLKLCRADMHGSLMKVTRALNPCLIGIQGIVVMETRHTFQIIDKKNVLRIVPKQGTSFTFAIDEFVVTVNGASFIMKPSERAVRKWKRKPTFDL